MLMITKLRQFILFTIALTWTVYKGANAQAFVIDDPSQLSTEWYKDSTATISWHFDGFNGNSSFSEIYDTSDDGMSFGIASISPIFYLCNEGMACLLLHQPIPANLSMGSTLVMGKKNKSTSFCAPIGVTVLTMTLNSTIISSTLLFVMCDANWSSEDQRYLLCFLFSLSFFAVPHFLRVVSCVTPKAIISSMEYFGFKFTLKARSSNLILNHPTATEISNRYLAQGRIITVEWSHTGWVNYVNVELRTCPSYDINTCVVSVLALQAPGSGSIDWKVPTKSDQGGDISRDIDYYLVIIHLDEPNELRSYGSDAFNIYLSGSPYVKWLVPRVGTQWQPGTHVQLTWDRSSSVSYIGGMCVNITRSFRDENGTLHNDIRVDTQGRSYVPPIGTFLIDGSDLTANVFTFEWDIPVDILPGSYQLLLYTCKFDKFELQMDQAATLSDIFTIDYVPQWITFGYPPDITSVVLPVSVFEQNNYTDGQSVFVRVKLPYSLIGYPLTLTLMKRTTLPGAIFFDFTTLTTTLMAVTQTSVNGELFGYATFEWIVNGGDVCILPRRKSSVYSLRVTSNYSSVAITAPFSISPCKSVSLSCLLIELQIGRLSLLSLIYLYSIVESLFHIYITKLFIDTWIRIKFNTSMVGACDGYHL
jgi:hypothetical protein